MRPIRRLLNSTTPNYLNDSSKTTLYIRLKNLQQASYSYFGQSMAFSIWLQSVNRVPEKQQALTIHLCSRTFLPGMPSVSQNKVPAPPGPPPLLKMELRDHSLSHLNFIKSAQVNAKFFYVQYFGLIFCYTEYFLTAGFFIFSPTITCLN